MLIQSYPFLELQTQVNKWSLNLNRVPPVSINVSKHQINIQMYLIISTQGSMSYLDSL